jgi:hypothetical protein
MPLNPPPLIAANLGLIIQPLKRSDQSRTAELTFAVDVIAGASSANAQDAIDDFQANFNAQWAVGVDTDVTFLQPTIKLGDGTAVPYEAVAAGATINGSDVVDKVPPNVAVLIKKSTGFGGRSNHGRTYFPFLLSQANCAENGTISGATISAYNTVCAAMLAQLLVDGTGMVIAHKVFNTPLPPHHVTSITMGAPVTSWAVEPLVGTQRRRLGR